MSSSAAFAELGLAPGASDAEVKAAWRRLSHWHPDRNPSAQALVRMQRINQAYKAVRRGTPWTPAGPAPGAEPAPA